jgi:hypothetical protein
LRAIEYLIGGEANMRFQVLINTFCSGRVASSVASFLTYESAEEAVEQVKKSSGTLGDTISRWAVRLYKQVGPDV